MKRTLFALILTIGATLAPAAGTATPARPYPAISRVLLVSVDGLRPDLALLADAPTLRGLMKRGSYSMWAQTTDLAVTLPSHTSMLTGVSPRKHGVTWNSAQPADRLVYPKWPTLFEIAHAAGYTTAMAAGKSKFTTLAKPGSLTKVYVPTDDVVSGAVVADHVVDWIEQDAPQVLFVHFPGPDATGHSRGWGSPEQLESITRTDAHIARILDALRARGVLDSTLIIVTADHGGAGDSHGPNDVRSRMIPWIIAGPGVHPAYDLTRDEKLTIHTEDTFATLAYALGLKPPKPIEGRPVLQAFAPPAP